METLHRVWRIVSLVICSTVFISLSYRECRAQDFLHETKSDRDARMKWWREARFGLFIHWGLYSIPAGEWGNKNDYGEWIRNSAHIPLEEYEKFVGKFNPVLFDAKKWVRMAKDAGMKYIVITSKHHDGFCMFDSKNTAFDIMSTPFHRDVLKELSAACREEGIRLCFYYSIMDWHHPDYLPRREWEMERTTEGAMYSRYIQYMKNQLKELLTNYGDIGVLWFDGEWESTWNHSYGNDLYSYVRNLQPNIIVNNRVGAGRTGMEGFNQEGEFAGDFGTPEQEIPSTGLPGVDWETCMTMNDHWGYNKADTNFKSSKDLIRNLVDIASKGGNFLLNIGPTSDGVFPNASISRLKDIGQWMKINGESIYGTESSPFSSTPWGKCTRKEMPGGHVNLYFHLFEWPSDGVFRCTGLGTSPLEGKVYLLQQPGQSLPWTRRHDTMIVTLPKFRPDTVDAVIAMEFAKAPVIFHPPTITAKSPIFIENMDVTLSVSFPNSEIRYTIDGSPPNGTSSVYGGPIHLMNTVSLRAQSFFQGDPVSEIVTKEFKKVVPEAALQGADLLPGLRYSYFEGDWNSIPAFDSLTPVAEGTTPAIDLQMRKRNEYFGVRYTGCFGVPSDGVYRVAITSDDGSRLYIGNRLIVDNDSLHGSTMKDDFIPLAKGAHSFRLDYFNKTGDREIRFQVAPVDQKLTDLEQNSLFHPK